MKKTVLVLALAILWVTAATAGEDMFGRVQEFTLSNGLKVLLLPEPRAPVVTLQVWYKVGSRNEVLGQTGLSHVLEHLMFRGTAKYGPKVFSRLVQKHGGNDNAFTSKDYTAYFENGPVTSLPLWLEMEADRMRNLKINEDLFLTERQVVIEERRQRTEDDPISALMEETVATAFKAHPYQWPIIGWMHDLTELRREDLLAHYHTYYQPNNATLVVVGDIQPEAILPKIKATFGKIPPGPPPPAFRPLEPPQQGERQVTVQREAQLPFLVLAYHTPNLGHPDAFALEVLSLVLSQGRSSRLYQKIVYEQRLALEAGADYDLASASPSLFTVYGQPLPGKTMAELTQALEAEITRVQDAPISAAELQKAKNQTEAAFIMAQDSIFYRGMLLGKYATIADWKKLREIVPGIRAVTQEDVQRVARTYLTPLNRTVGTLIPVKTDKAAPARFKRHDQIK